MTVHLWQPDHMQVLLPKLEVLTSDQYAQLIKLIAECYSSHNHHGNLSKALETGKWLCELKAQVPHGKWQEQLPKINKLLKTWKKPQLARSTAEAYMEQWRSWSANPQRAGDFVSQRAYLAFIRRARRESGCQERQQRVADAEKEMDKWPDEENWRVVCEDNRKMTWPDADHIISDPVWFKPEQYQWLADFATKKLKPNGWLLVQCGQQGLIDYAGIFIRAGFKYCWTLAMVFDQHLPTMSVPFNSSWRPVMVFSRKKRKPELRTSDTVQVSDYEENKLYDEWQQPLEPFLRWIPAFVKPGQLIIDPFCSTGTVAVAAKMTGRRFLGCDVRRGMIAVARKRIAEATPEQKGN